MKFTHLCRLLPALLLMAGSLSAQSKQTGEPTRSGLILDAKNQPIAGATVAVQETNTEVKTGPDGRFTIAANPTDVLVVQKSGFLGDTYPITGDGEIQVRLKAALTDAGDNDDVPIPFGMRKKRQINGAVSTFSARSLPQVPIASANATLAGRIPGFLVQQNGGAPGADGASFQIRGRNTFGPSTVAVLIDGVLRPFDNIDINEVESITVLKDAASLAWYGLRNANGVVLVTTRKGSSLRSNIHFDAQGGMQTPDNVPQPLNSAQFATLYNEALQNDGAQPIYNAATIDAYQSGEDPFRFPNNNYTQRFLNKSSASQRYVLSADGGNNTVRYFALLSYFAQDGLFKGAKNDDFNANVGFSRFNFRGNIDFDVNKWLTVGLNVAGRSENRRQPGGNESATLLNLLYNTPPNAFPILNADGSYGGTSLFQSNPLGLLQDRGFTSFVTRVMMATMDVRQKLDFWVPGLSANVNFNYDVQGTYLSGLNRDYQVIDRTAANPIVFRNQTPLGYRTAAFGATNQRNEAWAGLDYDRTFGQHNIRASVRGQRFVDAAPERLDFRGQGLSARADYSFRDRYYLGFVGSYSGSENFPPGQRYGFFPAVTAGWVMFDEAQGQTSPVLSYVKLRASHGQAGSSDIGGSRFPFENFYARNTGGGGYAFGTGFSATNSANEVSIANPNITWETLTTTNIGADLHLFQHALTLSADVFRDHRTGILTQSAIPSILGQTLTVNEGEVRSQGVDLSASYTKQIGAVNVSLYGNGTLTDDRVLAENGQAGLPDYQRTTGQVVGSRLVFVSDGLFQNQAQIDASPRQTLSGKVVPGDIKYKDVGGVNGTPDGIIDNLDRVRINQPDIPKAYFGFGTVLRYKLFDLTVHFQGVNGRTIDVQGLVNSGPNSLNLTSLDRWTPVTTSTALYPRLGISDRANNTSASDFWLAPGDYVRLKNAEIGLTMPQRMLNRYAMRNARLYVGGFNLLVFDKLKLDVDPEVPGAGRGSAYPYIKTLYVGLRASF